jgi:hypothetical protein
VSRVIGLKSAVLLGCGVLGTRIIIPCFGVPLSSLLILGFRLAPLPCQLSYDGELKKESFYWTYKVAMKKVENKILYYKETAECTGNILAKKSGEGPLPYCKTGAESEGNNRPGLLVGE